MQIISTSQPTSQTLSSVPLWLRAAVGVRTLLTLLGGLLLTASPEAVRAQSVSFAGAQTTLGANSFSAPVGLAVDASGNVFVADLGTHTVKEILAAGGYITVKTISSDRVGPWGVALDASGNVFVGYDFDGVKEILAASGYTTAVSVGSGFGYAYGVALDRSGNLFVADPGAGAVKEILAAGGYTTIETLSNDFRYPAGVALDKSGNLFVTESSFDGSIEEILAEGGYTTVNLLGGGVNSAFGVAADGDDNIFVTDGGNNAVREILAEGGYSTVHTLYGSFDFPDGVALDGKGDVFISDGGQNAGAVFEMQLGTVNYGSVNLCAAGQTTPAPCSHDLSLHYDITASGTLGTPKVVVNGAPSSDFTFHGSTCPGTVTSGSTCLAHVTFVPTKTGLRTGILEIVDGNGKVLASTALEGTGVPVHAPIDFQGFTGAEASMHFRQAAGLDFNRLQLTKAGSATAPDSLFKAGSAFYNTPQNIQSFTTDFTFLLGAPAAGDGLTFTIQNEGVNPLGIYGEGLGYEGIGQSVAVKFDLHNNAGEGPDSTGIYTNGALPTVPALPMQAGGVNLHNGDIFAAHLVYDGTNLTLTLIDTTTQATFTHSFPIDIPKTVGGSTAYVGFTGGTGLNSADQEILTWTFSNP